MLFKLRNNYNDLGHLESTVMDILWNRGESNVRDVVAHLARPLAYTTVMTTLDRLFKKGLLERRKEDRAFIYIASVSKGEWETRRAANLLRKIFTSGKASNDVLISCLVDAVGEQNAALLDHLESEIRVKRTQLQNEEQSK
jgi:predicted transcriptional regulator